MNSTKLLNLKPKSGFEKKGSHFLNILKNLFKALVLMTPLLLLTHLFHDHDHIHHHPPVPETKSPYLAPNVTPEMLKADFWITKIPDASQILMTPIESNAWDELEAGEKGHLIYSLANFDRLTTRKEIVSLLEKDLAEISEKKLFSRNRAPVLENELKQLEEAQNKSQVPEADPIRFGILVRDSNIRVMPTNEPLTQEAGDLEFDELQNSRARAFTCLRILHVSKDGGWFYVQLPDVHGWVSVEDVAFVPNKRAVKSLSSPESFLVVLGDRVVVYSDPQLKTPLTQVRMGTKLALISAEDLVSKNYTVHIPIKGSAGLVDLTSGYVKKSEDVRVGYLPLSRENILRQAFKLLGEPYGWGGLWQARDCSSFIQDIFSTMGVTLPRNSKSQAESGSLFVQFDDKTSSAKKEAALEKALPVTSLLRLNGHIMLYLGEVNGKFYAIHDSSGYKQPGLFKEKIYKLNQVIVSDLSLGKGSKKKSLIERLISINTIA